MVVATSNGRVGHLSWYDELMPGDYATLGGLIVGKVIIGPESAAILLRDRNGCNRSPVKSQVELLARAQANGEWQVTGETIIFDDEGNIRNGQHRLLACIESGALIETVVVIGVKPEVFRVLDQHTKRSTGQVLGIMGEVNCATLASAVILLGNFIGTGALVRKATSRKTTIDEQIGLLDKHPGLRESVGFIRRHETRIFQGAGLPAACHYLFGRLDPILASEFFDNLLRYKVPTAPEWQAADLLLARLVNNLSSREKLGADDISALTVKAWNSVYERRPLRHLRLASGEAFPLISGWRYHSGIPAGLAS